MKNLSATFVRIITYIPAQEEQDAPTFTDKQEMMDEIQRIEREGKRAVVLDQDGHELFLPQIITMSLGTESD